MNNFNLKNEKINLIIALIYPIFLLGQDFISDSAAIKISYGCSPDRKVEGTNVEIGGSQLELMTPLYYHDGGDWSFGAGLRLPKHGHRYIGHKLPQRRSIALTRTRPFPQQGLFGNTQGYRSLRTRHRR